MTKKKTTLEKIETAISKHDKRLQKAIRSSGVVRGGRCIGVDTLGPYEKLQSANEALDAIKELLKANKLSKPLPTNNSHN